MKNIKAHYNSTCMVCFLPVSIGQSVVLMKGRDFKLLNLPENCRNHWVHKECVKQRREELRNEEQES